MHWIHPAKNFDLLVVFHIPVLSSIEPNQRQNTSSWAWHCWTPGLVYIIFSGLCWGYEGQSGADHLQAPAPSSTSRTRNSVPLHRRPKTHQQLDWFVAFLLIIWHFFLLVWWVSSIIVREVYNFFLDLVFLFFNFRYVHPARRICSAL